MTRFLHVIVAWVAITVVQVATQVGVAAQSDFSAIVEQARSALSEDRLPKLALIESQLREAMDSTESLLSHGTSPDNFAAWQRFLNLPVLRKAIENESSVAARGRAAVELRQRLVGPEAGLELSSLLRLREQLDRYIAALQYGSDPEKGIMAVDRELTLLGKILDRADEANGAFSELTPEAVSQLESLVQSISKANQCETLTSNIRGRFSQPNLRVWIAGHVVTDAIMKAVDDCSAVNDCILGTRLRGTSRLMGGVRAELLPSVGYIRLMVRLDGTFTSSTRGVNGPVELDTTGNGQVYAARQVAITERGVTLGEVVSTAQLNTQIQRIIHPLRIVRRIAAKEAAEKKPQSEAIARSKLENRVVTQFREQTDQAGAKRFDNLDDAMRPWLTRLDIPRPERVLESTSLEIFASAKIQRERGLASPISPPDPKSVLVSHGRGISAAVQVHESIVSNSIASMFSGETLNPQKLGRMIEGFGIELPEDALADVDFEIDFATFRPVFFEARDGELRLGIRGSRFSQGDRELNRTLQVVATYRPVLYPDGKTQLEREDKLDLSFPGGRRLTIAQAAIKANIVEGFDKLFPSALLMRPLTVPLSVSLPALKGKAFQVASVDAQNGWLSIGIR